MNLERLGIGNEDVVSNGTESSAEGDSKELVILFWAYKELDICIERLQVLKNLNPLNPVYLLFGGPIDEANDWRNKTHAYVDGFYVYPHTKEPIWKWRHGEQLIKSWYLEFGVHHSWKRVAIVQWDLVILEPISGILANIDNHTVGLTGLRSINEVQSWWWWTLDEQGHLKTYQGFLAKLQNLFPQLQPKEVACQFIFSTFPRDFLYDWASQAEAEDGFLEYTIPMYAECLGYHISDLYPECLWPEDPKTTKKLLSECKLRANHDFEIGRVFMALTTALLRRPLWFHPYRRRLPKFLTIILPIISTITKYSDLRLKRK